MTSDFISKRITQLLYEHNMSEYELSTRLGKSKGYIQKITSQKSLPSIPVLYDICDCFNLTLSEFFEEPKLKTIYRKPIRDLMEVVVPLDDKDIQLLITLTRDFKSRS